jgi:hypothetical protein
VNDPLAVAELEPPATKTGPQRALPFLWTAVGILLMTAIAAAVLGWADDDRTPGERVAAASAAATAEDYGFEVTFEGLEPVGSFRLTGGVDAGTKRMRGVMDLQGMKIETIQDGLVQYSHLPPAMRKPGDKPWLRIDLGKLGVRVPAGPASTATNPIAALRELDAIVGEVEEVGHEKVRGTETTHFRFTVDATRTQPPGTTLPAEQIERLRRVPVDLWLDGDDHPRRVRQTVDTGASAAGKLTTTFETFDFGKDVTVALPPPDDVQEFDLGALGATFGGGAESGSGTSD